MYFSKTGILTISGLLIFSSIALAASTPNIGVTSELKDPTQYINTINFIKSGSKNEASMIFDGNININAQNFILQSAKGDNTIKGYTSNILGGKNNVISGATNSVIIAGSGNNIFSNATGSVIAGGKKNTIHAKNQNSTILGGESNIISNNSQSSTIVGGYNNTLSGKFSAIAGFNNSVTGDYSIALGSGSKVKANNSFLWNDGTNVGAIQQDDVFVVLGGNGLIVNTNSGTAGSKLSIGGSLNVSPSDNDNNISCGGGQGKGILKTIKNDKNASQDCFCTCNGESRESILGEGSCSSLCKNLSNLTPTCGTEYQQYSLNGKNYYSGSCKTGSVIPDSYYLKTDNGIHVLNRVCQEIDGTTEKCSVNLNN